MRLAIRCWICGWSHSLEEFLANGDVGMMRVMHGLQGIFASERRNSRRRRSDPSGNLPLTEIEDLETFPPAFGGRRLVVEVAGRHARFESHLPQEINQYTAISRLVALNGAERCPGVGLGRQLIEIRGEQPGTCTLCLEQQIQ